MYVFFLRQIRTVKCLSVRMQSRVVSRVYHSHIITSVHKCTLLTDTCNYDSGPVNSKGVRSRKSFLNCCSPQMITVSASC